MYTAKVKLTAKSTLPNVRIKPLFLTGLYKSGKKKMAIPEKKEDLRNQVLGHFSNSNPECIDLNVEIIEFKKLPIDFWYEGKEK